MTTPKLVKLAHELTRAEDGGRRNWQNSMVELQTRFNIRLDVAAIWLNQMERLGLIKIHAARTWRVLCGNRVLGIETITPIAAGPLLLRHFPKPY
jgi:hypothetical protein